MLTKAYIEHDYAGRFPIKNNTNFDSVNAPRNMGVETGGCPHTAIRENASMNLAAIVIVK